MLFPQWELPRTAGHAILSSRTGHRDTRPANVKAQAAEERELAWSEDGREYPDSTLAACAPPGKPRG